MEECEEEAEGDKGKENSKEYEEEAADGKGKENNRFSDRGLQSESAKRK